MRRLLLMIMLIAVVSVDLFAQQKEAYTTEVINGKKFIVHKVEEKETLFAISRKYGVSIYTILEVNPTADAGLEIGQLIKVPYLEPIISTNNSSATEKIVHIVKEKETLYAISRMYNVSPEEIREWNNLPDNSISPGQELSISKAIASSGPGTLVADMPNDAKGRKLHRVSAGETMYSISKQYGVGVQQIKAWNNMPNYDLSNGQVLIVSDMPETEGFTESKEPVEDTVKKVEAEVKTEHKPVTETQTIIIDENVKSINEVKERGQAELIDGKDANRKHLALHRTAAIGTLIKVRNEMNNREVWVKVVGKLPDTGENNKVLIKISRSAYQQLGAIDNRFLVELIYYK